MVEFSAGYKDIAKRKQEELERSMSPKAVAVARGMFSHFEKSATRAPETPKPAEKEAA